MICWMAPRRDFNTCNEAGGGGKMKDESASKRQMGIDCKSWGDYIVGKERRKLHWLNQASINLAATH